MGNGQIIMANRAACKLLAYSKKELLLKNWSAIFETNELSFKKMQKQLKATGKSVAVVTAIKKNGKPFPCEITSAVFANEQGIHKSVTTISDLSQAILEQKIIDTIKEKIVADNIVTAHSKQISIDKKKAKLVAGDIILAKAVADKIVVNYSKWIKHIARTSYDVMWDWDLRSGLIYVGESVKEIFGYRLKNNTVLYKKARVCLFPEHKELLEDKLFKKLNTRAKYWNDSFPFKRSDGSMASVICRAIIIRSENGKAIRLIGAMQDVSRVKELEMELRGEIKKDQHTQDKLQQKHDQEIAAGFKLMFNHSTDVLFDYIIDTRKFILSKSYQEVYGHKKGTHAFSLQDWIKHIHPEDKPGVENSFKKALQSRELEWKADYRYLKSDNSASKVSGSGIILRDTHGKACRMIGLMQMKREHHKVDERLDQEIQLKERQIAQAMEDAKETERSDIGKELHDNVNQLLGAAKLYLDLAKSGDGSSTLFITRSSEYMNTAIEEIRKLTKGLTTDKINMLGLCDSIENMAHDSMETNPIHIVCALDHFIEDRVNDKFKLNIFRIIQEQLTNILKHSKATKVNIDLSQNKQSINLIITDNGIGYTTGKKESGIGMANIKSRVYTFNGAIEILSQPGKGCKLAARFPVSQIILSN